MYEEDSYDPNILITTAMKALEKIYLRGDLTSDTLIIFSYLRGDLTSDTLIIFLYLRGDLTSDTLIIFLLKIPHLLDSIFTKNSQTLTWRTG